MLDIAADYERKIKGKISVFIVSKKKIQTLNKQFRNQDKVTDVLSFPLTVTSFIGPAQETYLGELFICPAHIKEQAQQWNVSFKNEMIRMLVHGLLHLAGHDHEVVVDAQKMFKLQEKIVVQIYKRIFHRLIPVYPIITRQDTKGVYLS